MAKLSTAARKKLKSSQFVFPKSRGFPINDKAHAVAALRLVGRTHSAAKKARVHAAVARKFPGVGKSKR